MYRSTSASGTYTRLNSSIIPVGQESFLDTNVSPAVPMYYKFTVVQTDMTESDPSNVASAAALDTILPVIVHTPKTSAVPGAGLRLTATVTDNVGVEGVAVHYRPLGSTQAYVSLPMTNLSVTSWSVTIPGMAVQPPGVEYYLTARDELNTVYHGNAAAPHSVLVSAAPSLTSVSPNQGSSDGGLRVTLSGSQFQVGATVEFGGVPATDVVVQTSGQILCTAPAHFPALVDVRVVNPDASQATLLNGFRYVDDDAVLSLPTMSADRGAIVDVPIWLAQVDGLRSAQLTVTFDAAVLTVRGVSTGTLTGGWALEANTATAGRVVLSLAGATASSGDGTLAKLNVEVIGAVASQTALTLSNVLLNDGAIEPHLSNAVFAVNGFFTLSGTVKYFQGNRPVPGAELDLVGVGAQSASSNAGGAFSFPTVQTGAYTLTPDKSDQVVDITAYDASLILQAAAGKRTLTTNQRLAADVNRNGAVTAMDASYVLEKSVGLLTGLFPGAGCSWLFSPAERTYPLLNGNLANQDFTAILLGDVSGNWDGLSGGGGEGEGGRGEGDPGDPVVLTLPDVPGQTGGTVAVPLQIALGGAEVHALDLRLSYDSAQLTLLGVTAGAAAEGIAWAANTSRTGVIRIGMASSSAWSQEGDLLTLSFQVTGSLATPAPVSFQSASVDEGAVEAALNPGFVADLLPPAVSSLWPAAGAAGVAVQPQLSVTFTEAVRKGNGTILLRKADGQAVVESIDVAGAAVTVAGLTATIVPTVTLGVLTDYYVEVAAGAFEDLAGNGFAGISGAAAWNFATETLRVTGLLPTASGLAATFNGPLATTGLNLYDGAGGALGASDLSVLDGTGRAVAGSLVVDDSLRSVQWVATGTVLRPGTYTVTLRSEATAFHDGQGHSLDGDTDGTSGGDFSTQFTVVAGSGRVVNIPDFARGAGQSVHVPNAAEGLPIRIDNAEGVTAISVGVAYRASLLEITAATLAPGLPGGWIVDPLETRIEGAAKVTTVSAHGTAPLSGSNIEVVRLTAAVPTSAPYGDSQVIRLQNISLNGGAIPAVGDAAIHKAVYLGDADGSGIHSSADAFLTVQAALGLASGFPAHAWTDPRIVGDADGSGVLSAADAFLIVQEGLGLNEPFVPDNPRITLTHVGGGVDPQFRIAEGIPAEAGGVVTVPVMLETDPAATNVGGIDFELFFDPARLRIQVPDSVSAGADTAGWALSAVLLASGHLRVGMVTSTGQPLAPGLREIARLQFGVEAGESSRMGFQPVPDGSETRPTLLPPITDYRSPITDRLDGSETRPTVLDIEPVDARAGGYKWTDADGSVLIRPAQRTLAGATRQRIWRDLDAKADLLESVLADLVHEIASAWR